MKYALALLLVACGEKAPDLPRDSHPGQVKIIAWTRETGRTVRYVDVRSPELCSTGPHYCTRQWPDVKLVYHGGDGLSYSLGEQPKQPGELPGESDVK